MLALQEASQTLRHSLLLSAPVAFGNSLHSTSQLNSVIDPSDDLLSLLDLQLHQGREVSLAHPAILSAGTLPQALGRQKRCVRFC